MDELQPYTASGVTRERDDPTGAPEWMLRELNHRTANSLQLAVDLLGLHMQRSTDQAVRRALDDAMARLATVGQLHRHLSLRDGLAPVELGAFLTGLCPAIGASMGLDCRLAAEPVRVPAKTAQLVGLLVNECAINARKHAYGPEGGLLRVESAVAAGRLVLIIADRGCGLQAEPDAGEPGLGMGIIEAILKDLGGRMSVESRDGARFTFVIPIAPAGPDRSFASWSEP